MPADTLTEAIAATHPNPSAAQREAGNYRKGKLPFHGLTISIETLKGQRRKSEHKPLACPYGYFLLTEGRDGDHVDVFVGPNLKSEIVFVVDQVTEGGRFDEHKIIAGCVSRKQAKRLYLANYPAGWKCGPITAMTIQQFKTWLAKGDTTKRVAEQVSRYDKFGSQNPIPKESEPSLWPPGAGAAPGSETAHQVGETKSVNGTTFRLNENHRWELADQNEAGPGQPGMGNADQQQPPEAPPPPPSPANDQAARHSFVASKVKSVHPELGGLIQAIHQSPHYQASGDYVSFDVHKKVAADLHHSLSQRVGQEHGGGNVVDLGQGRVGFASEAGSLVVWPADESGRHRVSYTNKTGVVGRAMAKEQPGQGQQPGGGQSEEENGDPSPGGNNEQAQQVPAGEQSDPEPIPPPRPGIPRGKPVEQPGQSAAPAAEQSTPGGQSSPSESAYDAELVPAKEKPAHVRLRARANDAKAKAVAARDELEKAVDDNEHPKRIRKLKAKFSQLREIYNDHDRHAKRAEAGHKARLKDSGKSTKERMKQLGIGPFKPKVKPEKPEKEPKAGKPSAPSPDANLPKGTMPDDKAKLSRSFSAGNNRGSIQFENEQHRDLYDLGAKHSYVGRGGRNKTSDRHVGDIKALTAKLTESTGMSEQEVRGHAAEVHKHTKGQMKGLKDGEHREAKMPTAKDTAPLVDAAEQNEGQGRVRDPQLQKSGTPKPSDSGDHGSVDELLDKNGFVRVREGKPPASIQVVDSRMPPAKRTAAEGQAKTYRNNSGHTVQLSPNGKWSHSGEGGKSISGEDIDSLASQIGSKPKKSKEREQPLLDQAEKNPGQGAGNIPEVSPEALEMGKLPTEAQRAGAAAQTYLKTAGLSVSPENHRAIQHAIRKGWVKDKRELRGLLKRAKVLHGKGSAESEARGKGATNDHDALKEAIRRKANRERRVSWAATVREKANHWEMPAKEFHDTASQFYKEFSAPHVERENVKSSLRSMLGKHAGNLRLLEEKGGKDGRGGDYSQVKGLDQAAEYLQANFPHLMKSENAEQEAWNMVKEGRQRPPGKTDPEFMDKFEEALNNGYTLAKDTDLAPPADEKEAERRRTADDSVPFAKVRDGSLFRYVKDILGNQHVDSGPHGGEFTGKGSGMNIDRAKVKLRLSSVGADVIPHRWSYGDSDSGQKGFQVWDDIGQAIAAVAGDSSLDGNYSTEDGYSHLQVVVPKKKAKPFAGGNFWSSLNGTKDIESFGHVESDKMLSWLKDKSGAWDGEEWDHRDLKKWIANNEDEVLGWLEENAVSANPKSESTF